MEDFYELLGVSEDASADEVDRAWRERVHRYHPDVNDDARANAQFKTLQTAHEVLTDETERAAYDRLGHETYVEERLDGLPTPTHPAADDSREPGDGSDPDGPEREGRDDASARQGTVGGSRSGRSDAREHVSDGASTAKGRGRVAAPGATNTGAAGDEATERETRSRTAGASTAGERTPSRRPLAYGWVAIVLASTVYLVGLWAYLDGNAAALAVLSGASSATLPAVFARSSDLVAPGSFVLDAAATGAVRPLAFGVGAVGLAVGFLAVVVSFGRGAAYLYAVGGLAPAAALAVGPVVAAPDGVVLLLVVAVPAATAGLFIVDVGRELLAGP